MNSVQVRAFALPSRLPDRRGSVPARGSVAVHCLEDQMVCSPSQVASCRMPEQAALSKLVLEFPNLLFQPRDLFSLLAVIDRVSP